MAAVLAWPVFAAGDELTQMIQQDLTALGYETGGATGEMTTTTAVAISRFQAEHGLEVTGEASPQLAGIVKAAAALHAGMATFDQAGVAVKCED